MFKPCRALSAVLKQQQEEQEQQQEEQEEEERSTGAATMGAATLDASSHLMIQTHTIGPFSHRRLYS